MYILLISNFLFRGFIYLDKQSIAVHLVLPSWRVLNPWQSFLLEQPQTEPMDTLMHCKLNICIFLSIILQIKKISERYIISSLTGMLQVSCLGPWLWNTQFWCTQEEILTSFNQCMISAHTMLTATICSLSVGGLNILTVLLPITLWCAILRPESRPWPSTSYHKKWREFL